MKRFKAGCCLTVCKRVVDTLPTTTSAIKRSKPLHESVRACFFLMPGPMELDSRPSALYGQSNKLTGPAAYTLPAKVWLKFSRMLEIVMSKIKPHEQPSGFFPVHTKHIRNFPYCSLPRPVAFIRYKFSRHSPSRTPPKGLNHRHEAFLLFQRKGPQ